MKNFFKTGFFIILGALGGIFAYDKWRKTDKVINVSGDNHEEETFNQEIDIKNKRSQGEQTIEATIDNAPKEKKKLFGKLFNNKNKNKKEKRR